MGSSSGAIEPPMKKTNLLLRGLTYYWRTHIAVVLGVALAVAVLAGALMVGDSVRSSLRGLFLNRLGATDFVITSPTFFRDDLADELREGAPNDLAAACPLMVLEAFVTHEQSGGRSSHVPVYGIDDRFWLFHGAASHPEIGDREVLLTEALAEEIGASPADTILLRIGQPSDIPEDSLHGRKEDVGRTLRLTLAEWPAEATFKEFAIYPHQGTVRAAFVSLGRLQRDLERPGRANTMMLSQKGQADLSRFEDLLKQTFHLEDVGVKLRWLERASAVAVESESILIDDALAEAAGATADELGLETVSAFTYLANSMKVGDKDLPYSLVTAIDPAGFERLGLAPTSDGATPIVLNEWAAGELGAQPGDPLSMEFYVWQDSGRLTTESQTFEVAGQVDLKGAARDPDWAPLYPGISESDRVVDWDPTFPVDFDRIRKRDEDYWDDYRTTPKAFIPLTKGQELWGNRYGNLTSIRAYVSSGSEIDVYKERLRDTLDPFRLGFSVYPAREEGLEASRGATDFGEYFTYFSFFLVVSSLLLTGLFFKLGIEQRLREVGLYHAMGFPPKRIRSLFLNEGAVLAILGSLLGLAGAVAYAWLIMLGLKTWWVDSVGTRLLTLHVSPVTMLMGGVGGVLAALLAIAWTLRGLRPVTPRHLLTGGELESARSVSQMRRPWTMGVASFALASILVGLAVAGVLNQVAGFFGAGSLLLVALLCFQWIWLRRKEKALLVGSAPKAVWRLGLRNATYRPGRSLLSIALIAFAGFVIVAVDAFRRGEADESYDKNSGNGGFPLLAESLLPLYYDPNTTDGKEALNLPVEGNSPLENVNFVSFRVRPGEDASCLNMYRPTNPRITAVPDELVESGRFAFSSSLAGTEEEAQNPWLLLRRPDPDGAVPVIGDANSMTYVLHLGLGDELVIPRSGDKPLRVRLVATLANSLFQGELLMGDENFRRLFPEEQGFRFFLMDATHENLSNVTETLEQRLGDFGFDVVTTHERIAEFHRVENTYLSTFQSLGGLGLILGTFGVAVVMLRNILERRGELALLRAVGYNSGHFAWMVIAENALLLLGGVLTGTVCAIVAIAPALAARGEGFSIPSVGMLLLAVFASGVISSVIAVRAAIRSPLLEALRAE